MYGFLTEIRSFGTMLRFYHPEAMTLFGMALVVFGCLLPVMHSRFNAKPVKTLAYENT